MEDGVDIERGLAHIGCETDDILHQGEFVNT